MKKKKTPAMRLQSIAAFSSAQASSIALFVGWIHVTAGCFLVMFPSGYMGAV